jgi:hypothetical protein
MNGKMPGHWNANESYQWLKENCPGMEATSCSRSPTAPATSALSCSKNNVPYLVKPFEVAELITQARKLLQKAHAAAAGVS